ncbi:LysR family transcriptional regulator [Roseovarius sp. SCSIO 43702]|uniref:hydrogen peroxide-inducible genes activator n=1 Tax=Roseovarius sp. SCSIO 43702 TaxID=2823043 RepID=UPI001C7350FD|nr:hydrogen peroxide-inducible genes activator [Roseovarius sp. SCSIO 43702]QYX55310.1 LysR family transcriptional regulator [Roseovarius sp. SCSIO 43702]
MNVTLRQLAYFRALAEQRHFGRAAETVNISQPALSVQIREMEAQLGQPLVERRARDVVLTPFGRTVLRHAERIAAEMRALEEAARWHGGLAGRLRLGMIPTIAPYILPATLEALRSHDIALDVEIEEGRTERLLGELQAGRLDAAVMAEPVGEEGMHAEPLFEDRFLLAGTAARLASLDADAAALRPETLATAQLLLLEDGHCLTDQALELCNRDRGQRRIDMGASSMATLSRLVAAGFGLTLMPEIAAPTERRAAPGMTLRRFAAPEPGRRIVLVRRKGTDGGGWFSDLAALLSRVGEALVATAREMPFEASETGRSG